MNFVIGLLVLTNYKKKSYDYILIIINWLIKIVHYKSIKVIINALELVKIFLNTIIQHHSLLNWNVSNKNLLSLLC